MGTEAYSLLAAGLLAWVALVHLVLATGVRRGELVWAGHYPRLLAPPLRRMSIYYAVAVLLSAWVIAAFGGAVDLSPVPHLWMRSAGWVVTVFLGMAALLSFLRGSRWERFLFGPITLFGAVLAGLMTFA